jgi:hypothetical protein
VRQKGFVPLLIILLIVILGVVGYFGYIRTSLFAKKVKVDVTEQYIQMSVYCPENMVQSANDLIQKIHNRNTDTSICNTQRKDEFYACTDKPSNTQCDKTETDLKACLTTDSETVSLIKKLDQLCN